MELSEQGAPLATRRHPSPHHPGGSAARRRAPVSALYAIDARVRHRAASMRQHAYLLLFLPT